MKARREQLTQNHGRSFLAYPVEAPEGFPFYWHFHPEYELTYILEGKGMRLVGDHLSAFAAGDLVLLGPGLPHTWTSHDAPGNALVIQFPAAFLHPLKHYPECVPIINLLARAAMGLQFPELPVDVVLQRIQSITRAEGAHALFDLFNWLSELARLPAAPLASPAYILPANETRQQRINAVFQYIQQAYSRPLNIQEAARQIYLSKSAFCKFFKRACGKTFTDYVNEVRTAKACTLLVETDQPISAVAAACGFENLAYFNRVFLRKKEISPGQYRKLSRYT